MDNQEKIQQLTAELNRYTRENNNEEVIKSCNELIKLDSNIKEAYFNRGLAYAHLKKREEAIINYTEAINLDIKINTNPTFKEPYNSRGNAYNDLGKYDEAINDFDKAINLDPTYANAYNNRGISYSKLGIHNEAINDFDKAINLDPNSAETHNNRAKAYEDLEKQNETSESIGDRGTSEDFNKATELDPNFKETDNNLKKHDETLESVKDRGTSADFLPIEYHKAKEFEIKNNKLQKDSESDRKLKIEIKNVVTKIVTLVMGFCIILIIFDALYFVLKDKHVYSEWFLATLLGSQLVILPLSLLAIITRSLFPPKEK